MTERVVVQTPSGSVRGVRRPGSIAFLGIPFAEAPVGPLRFLAPVPRAPWTDVLDADAYGPTPQRHALAEITAIPEPSIPGDDTLTVNVFTPDTTPEAPLPVLVWIHGGGYVGGSPASPWYDGAAFNRDGVIVVTVAYRLGFDGFGHLPDAPDDRGVLDQILALRWVQRHIASFGGDPGRVTIGGQSAGGGSVLTLLASPAAAGLFAGVYSASGATTDIPLASAERRTADVAARLGVPATRAGFCGVTEEEQLAAQGDLFPAVGELSLAAVLGLATGIVGELPYGPVVDGAVLPEPAADALRSGAGGEVPLLLGTTADEFTGAFVGLAALLDGTDAQTLLTGVGLTEEGAARYLATLPAALPPSRVLGRWATDMRFRRVVVDVVDARRGADAGTWAYDFTFEGANGLAEHCLDVPFAFDVPTDDSVERIAGPNPPRALADALHAAVVAFVRTGDPGWPRATTGAVQRFDTTVERADDAYDSAAALG